MPRFVKTYEGVFACAGSPAKSSLTPFHQHQLVQIFDAARIGIGLCKIEIRNPRLPGPRGELRKRGISVMTSIILFTEEHDRKTIWDDVDFGIELKPDYVQYMQLGLIPGAKLYQDYEQEGKLDAGVPLSRRHGRDRIWFHQPNFTGDESHDYLTRAFRLSLTDMEWCIWTHLSRQDHLS